MNKVNFKRAFHDVRAAAGKAPLPHVSMAKVTLGTHVVYYATEGLGIHVLHYGTVWAVLAFLCMELLQGEKR